MTSNFNIEFLNEIFEVTFDSDGPVRNRVIGIIYHGFLLEVAELRMSHPNLYTDIKKKMDEESKKWWAVNKEITGIPSLDYYQAPSAKEKIIEAIKKTSLAVVFILFYLAAFCQQKNALIFSAHAEYSFHYNKPGGGFDAGYKFDHNYFGADSHIYFTKRQRNIPVEIDLHYGYNIGSFQPFVTAGFYTCGGEAVHNNEGVQGIAFGAGLSYFFEKLPLKFTTGITGNNIYSSISIVARL